MSETMAEHSITTVPDNLDESNTTVLETKASIPIQKKTAAFNKLTKAIGCNLIVGIASLVCESIAIAEDQKWNRISTHSAPFPTVHKEHHFSGRFMHLDLSNSHVSSAIDQLHRHNKVGFAFVGVTSLFIFLSIVHLIAYCSRAGLRTRDVHTDALYIIGGLTMLLMTAMLAAKALFEPSKYTKSAGEMTNYMLQIQLKSKAGNGFGVEQRDAVDQDDYDARVIALIKDKVAAAEATEDNKLGGIGRNSGNVNPSKKTSADQLTEATYWRSALLTCAQNTFFEGYKAPKGNDTSSFKNGFKLGGFHYTPEVLEELGFCDEENLRHVALWLCFAYSLMCCLIPCTPWCNVNQATGVELATETGETETFLNMDKIDEKKLNKLLQSGHITARRAVLHSSHLSSLNHSDSVQSSIMPQHHDRSAASVYSALTSTYAHSSVTRNSRNSETTDSPQVSNQQENWENAEKTEAENAKVKQKTKNAFKSSPTEGKIDKHAKDKKGIKSTPK